MRNRSGIYASVITLGVLAVGVKFGMHVYHQTHQHHHTVIRVVKRSLVTHQITDDTPVRVLGLRRFPYPYDAMLAISSDADDETLRKFNLIHEFINTREKTPFGYYGLGLPFADSVFMFNGSNLPKPVDVGNAPRSEEMSWFRGVSNQSLDAAEINHYIHAGWIDTLHSYGDFSRVNPHQTLFTRQLAKQAVDALQSHGDTLTVWTDHGNQSNVDDFGSFGKAKFYNYQQGADPKSPYYHANITIPYGVRFVWPDVASDVYGRTSMIYPLTLPDKQKVWGFWRYTSSGMTQDGSPIWDWTVGDLSQQITLQKLEALEKNHDYCIIAQHLEALNARLPLPQNAIDALWTLDHQYTEKKLLVATTSQLLNYNVVQQYLHYHVTYDHGNTDIHIDDIRDPVDGTFRPTLTDLRGITFYTSSPARTVIEIGDTPVPASDIMDNPSDSVGKSIGIKWFTWSTKNYVET
ncbi:hypothetical protein [Alicyclobacillus fodiniaquatilis]|uniref:Uncharacterized protein n=1 Tax=Alicyclobacillus fodiniaquatilis TaxID=1661150 RepID=A0ABW4JLE7_9BACL